MVEICEICVINDVNIYFGHALLVHRTSALGAASLRLGGVLAHPTRAGPRGDIKHHASRPIAKKNETCKQAVDAGTLEDRV